MTSFGMTLSSEEHPPRRLLEIATLAEETGFEFVSISDHYHPWIDAQGHSPFVWSMLGALAERIDLQVGVGVTCPIVRIHPAILAQATATTATLFEGRFVWGVGSGEALNEHILGDKWPPAPTRLEMLEEAIEVIRELWKGEDTSHHGRYYTVENARIYDPPEPVPPIVVSAFGPKATELAARVGDGLWLTSADEDAIKHWKEAGGSGPIYAQMTLCWAPTQEEAVETVHRIWPNTGVPGQLSQDLPTPAHFEQAAQMVKPDDIASSTPCGPDAGPVLEQVRAMQDAGIDHVYFHQIGADQEGFCRFWTEELQPELVSSPATKGRST
jgi:G6PDH family F420-dependent oxidoreductase